MSTVVCWLLILCGICGIANANYETVCGSVEESEYLALQRNVDVLARRLMSRRDDSGAWRNTPEALASLILAKPDVLSNVNASVAVLENQATQETSLGRFAQILLAAKASCSNTTNFGGVNLAKELKRRLNDELMLNGTKREPHGWYGVYLAVGAYCISEKQSPGDSIVARVLERQKIRSNFHKSLSADYTAQAMIALTCVMRVSDASDPTLGRIQRSLHSASNSLLAAINVEKDNVWIGNRYSTPKSLIALTENGKFANQKGLCMKILKSINNRPAGREPEAALSQVLPVLKGTSKLQLMNDELDCPSRDKSQEIQSIDENIDDPIPTARVADIKIDLEFIIKPNAYLGGDLASENVTHFDVTRVPKGTILHDTMVLASQRELMTFETRDTSWGRSLVGINGRRANRSMRQYWSIGANGKRIPVGIDRFIPSHGEKISFTLTTWS